MNKKSLKLPCIIFLFHLPIFLIKIDDIKTPILNKKKISINTIQITDIQYSSPNNSGNISSNHTQKTIKNTPHKKRKKIQKNKNKQKIVKSRKNTSKGFEFFYIYIEKKSKQNLK